MKLVWNAVEMGWQCSECGALYSDHELERVFNYSEQTPKNFTESHCMDCGCLWVEAEGENIEI